MPVEPPPPPGHPLFFLIACGVSILLAVLETAASFPLQGMRARCVLLNPWAMLLYAFYAAASFVIGLLLWESGTLAFSWAWAFGLGFGVPWAMQTGVTLFQPLDGKAKDFSLSFKEVTGRLKNFCYLRISSDLLQESLRRKEQLLKQDEDVLLARLELLYPPEEMDTIRTLVEDRRTTAPATVNAFLLAFIEKKDPAFPKPLPAKDA